MIGEVTRVTSTTLPIWVENVSQKRDRCDMRHNLVWFMTDFGYASMVFDNMTEPHSTDSPHTQYTCGWAES